MNLIYTMVIVLTIISFKFATQNDNFYQLLR